MARLRTSLSSAGFNANLIREDGQMIKISDNIVKIRNIKRPISSKPRIPPQ